MMRKLTRLFSVFTIIFVVVSQGVTIQADQYVQLIVHHLDAYGAPISEDTVYYGETGSTLTIENKGYGYFSPTTSLSYRFTNEENQETSIKYKPNIYKGGNGFYSLYLDSRYSEVYLGEYSAEYDGNLSYFPYMSNEELSIEYVYSANLNASSIENRVIDFQVILPQHKLTLSSQTETYVYVETPTTYDPIPKDMFDGSRDGKLNLSESGITVEYLYSDDGGLSYHSYENITSSQISNVVGRIKFSRNLPYQQGEKIHIISDLTGTINESNLSPEEMDGSHPISGFKYMAENFSSNRVININTEIYMISPTISGEVRVQDNQDLNWDNATPSENRTIELIDLENRLIRSELTNSSGMFNFTNVTQSFDYFTTQLSAPGYTTYIYYQDEDGKPQYINSTTVDSNLVPLLYSNTIHGINWKDDSYSKYALSVQNIRFLLVENEAPATYTVTYHGSGETNGSVPVDQNQYLNGEFVTIMHPQDLIKEGYTFSGWTVDNDTVTVYQPDDIYPISGNVNFYAQWTLNTTNPSPTDPNPTDPSPTNPSPTDPSPTDPSPTDPSPTDPSPTDPSPTNPSPTNPSPTNPSPTDPNPTDPSPTNPSPTNPSPTNPSPTNPSPTNPIIELPTTGTHSITVSIGIACIMSGIGLLLITKVKSRKPE